MNTQTQQFKIGQIVEYTADGFPFSKLKQFVVVTCRPGRLSLVSRESEQDANNPGRHRVLKTYNTEPQPCRREFEKPSYKPRSIIYLNNALSENMPENRPHRRGFGKLVAFEQIQASGGDAFSDYYAYERAISELFSHRRQN